jgi:D-amino-acid dehydrogenase
MPAEPGRPHVAVIGAGVIGAATALALLQRGCGVTIIDPADPGGPQAASYGNGAWISPGSVAPMSTPGIWRKIPGFLLDPLGPLTIRWSSLPGLTRWLAAFLRAGSTVGKVEATARALAVLLRDAPERHLALAAATGQQGLIRRDGLLYVYPDRAAFTAEALAWRLRRDNGVAWLELDADGLRMRAPALSERYRFGVLIPAGAHCADPGAYVAGLVRAAVAGGADLRRATASGFRFSDGRLAAVRTDAGDAPCDRAVIAAGVHSAALARHVGDAVPLASERGYHVEIADAAVTLETPVMPSDGKMANTSLNGRLRAAGQVELAAVDAPPDWRRAHVLLQQLQSSYPALDPSITLDGVRTWMGHRPSTPDGLPVIGPARSSADVIHAFGHGHVGLAAAPATAEIAADLAIGRIPALEAGPYTAWRFR